MFYCARHDIDRNNPIERGKEKQQTIASPCLVPFSKMEHSIQDTFGSQPQYNTPVLKLLLARRILSQMIGHVAWG